MAQDPHLALAGPELPRGQLQQRALARAVGAEQTRHARGKPKRQVVHADDVAVPFRDRTELDHRRARSSLIIHIVICPIWNRYIRASGTLARPGADRATRTRVVRMASRHEDAEARQHPGRPGPGVSGRGQRRPGRSRERGWIRRLNVRAGRPGGRGGTRRPSSEWTERTHRPPICCRPAWNRFVTWPQDVSASNKASRIRWRLFVYETNGHQSARTIRVSTPEPQVADEPESQPHRPHVA